MVDAKNASTLNKSPFTTITTADLLDQSHLEKYTIIKPLVDGEGRLYLLLSKIIFNNFQHLLD